MAAGNSINLKKIAEELSGLLKFPIKIDGRKLDSPPLLAEGFSNAIESKLEQELKQIPEWLESNPILIGSWGRHELCPKSDLDLIFLGPEEKVKLFLENPKIQGLKIRYRVPENLQDWSVGVEALDLNAIFWSRGLTEFAQAELDKQKKIVFAKKAKFRKKVFNQIAKEQALRNKRYDSIANYLEPNLKFGPGGLRDILQGRFLFFWYEDLLTDSTRAREIFSYYDKLFLTIRHWLHLNSLGDSLVATAQLDLCTLFGFTTIQEFMREIQAGLTRVKFYNDWLMARVKLIEKKQVLKSVELKSISDCFTVLNKNPDILTQHQVRNFLKNKKNENFKLVGENLLKYFKVSSEEKFISSLFESGVMAKVIPGFDQIRGWVQHDQYHRYSVDAHLMQTCLYVKRVFEKPKTLKKLKTWSKEFTPKEWQILMFAALYHDLGKGSQKHHSLEGAEMVCSDLANFGFAPPFIEEVEWLVKNHLVISQAAFKKNPNSEETKKQLFDQGIVGKRLHLLAVFTAIDIMATNIEAWTDWKETLIFNLVNELDNPMASQFYKFSKKLEVLKIPYLDWIEPSLIETVGEKILLKDLQKIKMEKNSSSVALYQDKDKNTWVRFYNPEDSLGLFAHYVGSLTSVGASIRHAYIKTDPLHGIYDWFLIRSTSALDVIKKRLEHQSQVVVSQISSQKVFDEIEFLDSKSEWILIFKGRDQRGMLIQAAHAVLDLGLNIKWAKVHTWGRNVDDIFGIFPDEKLKINEFLPQLRDRLIKK